VEASATGVTSLAISHGSVMRATMGAVEEGVAVMEDAPGTSVVVVVEKSVTSVTASDTLQGSAVRWELIAATSVMALAISQGIVHGHLMNRCAITVARVGTLLGNAQKVVVNVVVRAKLVTTVVSKVTLVANALIRKTTARMTVVAPTEVVPSIRTMINNFGFLFV